MARINTSLSILIVLCVLLSTGMYQCNTILDSEKITQTNLIDIEKSKEQAKPVSLYTLRPRIGDTIRFSGLQCCTVITNNQQEIRNDSVYSQFITGNDTVLIRGDSLYGKAFIHFADIPTIKNWQRIVDHFKLKDYIPLQRILTDQFDSLFRDSVIKACESGKGLTDQQHKKIIDGFNTILSRTDFYATYHKYWFEATLEFAASRMKRLIRENIFLDTTGTVNKNLSPYQLEIIKWFNIQILVWFLDIKSGTTVDATIFASKQVSANHILKFVINQSNNQSMEKYRSTEFFLSVSNNGLQKIAQKNNNEVIFEKETMISTIPFITFSSWKSVPWLPIETPIFSTQVLQKMVQPGSAEILYDTKKSNSYKSCYKLRMYYPISTAIQKNNTIFYYSGGITQALYFYIYTNNDNMYSIVEYSGWSSRIFIEEKEGTTVVRTYKDFKESVVVSENQ